ncbi:MAG: hypothetical protein GX793_08915 [Bacteroidales bacterium]|jgi:hypothetical protein|nr:hypothetical protein [Bacteroidales bacterium]MCK9497942.1 hypothetical protein [Bacteroidales bacterium]MDY0314694.1 hypothetical protein [Bacteroidales bacterium]NLB87166.1 hypothetical protein [Bacteroidales bacterium]OQC44743.1 MAG: hypothetical protein BWX59_01720 [Bacteroidetes bacterium ADurb.Bin028]
MGLSIHYSGNLRKASSLPSLIDEITEFCKVQKWKYNLFETKFKDDKFIDETSFDNIYGIIFTPPDCETISVCFLSNAKMISPISLEFWKNSQNENEKAWIYSVSVKTQFAGVKVHQLIILFFRYLNEKYFENFKMIDESNYWETNDVSILQKQFEKYNSLLDNFEIAIQTKPMQEDEDIISYLKRLADNVDNYQNKKKK